MNNRISGNQANSGAGFMAANNSTPVITNNIIFGNMAEISGGGIECNNSSYPVEITNNTLYQNSGQQYGGGIMCEDYGGALVTNTIIWSNYAGKGPELCVGRLDSINGSTLIISYSDARGGKDAVFVQSSSTLIWGQGMIDADPHHVDPGSGDFHLLYDSPCRDTGDNDAPEIPGLDFEDDPRIVYDQVDMGADEFHTHLYCTGQTVPGGNLEVKLVGTPAASPVGLCIGAGVLDPPLATKWGGWYLAFPILDPVVLPPMPAPEGLHVISGTLPAAPPGPYAIPMQAIIGDALTNLCVIEVE
jgi:hypothetical protein